MFSLILSALAAVCLLYLFVPRFLPGAQKRRFGPFGKPTRRESCKSRIARLIFNCFPCFWGSGGKVTYIAPDLREVRVRLPLGLRTRNYVGTIFGGSMFACTDPVLMLILIQNLGKDYIVWDKAGSIRFRKPGRSTLYAQFIVTESDLAEIRSALAVQEKLDRTFRINLVDGEGIVHAELDRVVNMRRKV
ncbi:MAG: DUF4442 domain-containing protein [Candidatus Obscuribacter sp.]|nr:DUF4442 domain-containing protein [Candidatus Melainabacteria bacterium]MDX1989086.1 DUF4442 domain-containing protein [Candidatus Obscuribacter sp.]